MLRASHRTKERRVLESTVHARELGNQGISGIQLTVETGGDGWKGKPLIRYGETLELRVRVHLPMSGLLELEVEE